MKFEDIQKEADTLLEILDNEALTSLEFKIRGLKEVSLVIEQTKKGLFVEGNPTNLELSELELKYTLNLLYRFSKILFYKKIGSVFKVHYRINGESKAKIIYIYKKAA